MALEPCQIPAPHHCQEQSEQKDAHEDIGRHQHEEDLHGRHQARQNAGTQVEHQTKHDERRRHLDADRKRTANGSQRQLRSIIKHQRRIERKHHIAVKRRRERHVVQIGSEDQHHPQETQKTAKDRPLHTCLRRVGRHGA